MKKLCLILSLLIFVPLVCFSQETLTITTYYPAPSGVYQQLTSNYLTVNPQTTAPTPATGMLYWDDGGGQGGVPGFYYYDGGGWNLLGGVGGGSLWTESAGNIYRDTGNVGIGTTNPAEKLTIEGDSLSTIRLNNNASGPDWMDDMVQFFASSSPAAPQKKNFSICNRNPSAAGGENSLVWVGHNDDFGPGTFLMALTHGGNLGIGTTVPQAPLHIAGSGNTQEIIQASSNGQEPYLILERSKGNLGVPTDVGINDGLGRIAAKGYYGGAWYEAASIDFDVNGYPTGPNDMAGKITFRVSDESSGNPTTAMVIRRNGQVNIGLDSWGRGIALLVNKSVTADAILGDKYADGVWIDTNLLASADNSVLTGLRISPHFFNLGYTGVKNYGLIVESGDVGIGTKSPDERFEVEWVDNGTDAEIGRGTTDTDITFIALRNASGTKCYIYPNPAGNGIVVSTTKP